MPWFATSRSIDSARINSTPTLATMEHSSSITARGLNGGELVADISARTSDAIRMMALAVSCVSMFAALLAVYWFVRMRRQFRHV